VAAQVAASQKGLSSVSESEWPLISKQFTAALETGSVIWIGRYFEFNAVYEYNKHFFKRVLYGLAYCIDRDIQLLQLQLH
jgi:hypothetical protein